MFLAGVSDGANVSAEIHAYSCFTLLIFLHISCLAVAHILPTKNLEMGVNILNLNVCFYSSSELPKSRFAAL